MVRVVTWKRQRSFKVLFRGREWMLFLIWSSVSTVRVMFVWWAEPCECVPSPSHCYRFSPVNFTPISRLAAVVSLYLLCLFIFSICFIWSYNLFTTFYLPNLYFYTLFSFFNLFVSFFFYNFRFCHFNLKKYTLIFLSLFYLLSYLFTFHLLALIFFFFCQIIIIIFLFVRSSRQRFVGSYIAQLSWCVDCWGVRCT